MFCSYPIKSFLNVPDQNTEAVGDYDFGLGLNMTFVAEVGGQPKNFISLDGRIVVDEVTVTTVRGGLHGRYDGDNEIDGKFSITICPNTNNVE